MSTGYSEPQRSWWISFEKKHFFQKKVTVSETAEVLFNGVIIKGFFKIDFHSYLLMLSSFKLKLPPLRGFLELFTTSKKELPIQH